METNEKVISSFKKLDRIGTRYGSRDPLEREYRVATVQEVERLLKAIKAKQEESSSSTSSSSTKRGRAHILIHELLPQSKNEAFSLRDGYVFDFGTIRTFYPDMEENFVLKYKLGVSRDIPEENQKSLCLPLALLHACAEEDKEEIRDLVMVQSVYATFGYDVPKNEEHKEQEVRSRNMDRGFFLIEDPDGKSRLMKDDISKYFYLYSALWGASFAGTGVDQKQEGQPQSQARADIGSWPPANLKEAISPLGTKLALLNAYTAWPKKGGTALHFAAATGRYKVVDLLLDLQVEIVRQHESAFASSSSGQTRSLAGEFSLSSGQLSMVDADGNNPLCCAAEANEDKSLVVIKLLSRQRGFPDDTLIRALTQRNNFNMAASMVAASKGHMRTLRCLVNFKTFYSSIASRPSKYTTHRDPTGCSNHFHYCVEHAEFNEFLNWMAVEGGNESRNKWSFIADGMLQSFNEMGATALDLALEKGRSDICALVLTRMNEEIRRGDMDIAYGGAAFLIFSAGADRNGNNVLHRYALGGGSEEAGEALIQWLELSASWLRKFSGSSSWQLSQRTAWRDLEWHGQLANLSTMDAMIEQLNCAGETPCITALKRGHKDALQILLPFWSKELACRYRNPVEWADTFLHCYAKSEARFDLTSVLPPGYTSSLVEALITTPNAQGHTPITTSLYSQQTTSFQWLLKQKELELQVQSDRVLHVYAYYCDDTQAGSALMESLGEEQVKKQLRASSIIKLRRQISPEEEDWETVGSEDMNGSYIEGTPLQLAVAGGNLQSCELLLEGCQRYSISTDAFFAHMDYSMDYKGNNVLHFLCTNIKNNNSIEEFLNIMATASRGEGTASAFVDYLSSSLFKNRNYERATPLKLALKRGSTPAVEWLLRELNSHEHNLEPDVQMLEAVFSGFGDDSCTLLSKDLFMAFRTSDTYYYMKDAVDKVLQRFFLNAISTSSEYIFQELMEETMSFEEDTMFWLEYLDCVSKLEKGSAIIKMMRNMQLLKAPHKNLFLHEALKRGNFEVLEIVSQKAIYEEFEQEFKNDQYQRLLQSCLCGSIPAKVQLFLVRIIHVNNCRSPTISWKRFLNLVGKNYEAVGAWMWAVRNLRQRRRRVEGPVEDSTLSSTPLENVEELVDVAAEMREHVSKTLMHCVKVVTAEKDIPNLLVCVKFLWQQQQPADEGNLESRSAALLDLLMEVQADNCVLVGFLLNLAPLFQLNTDSILPRLLRLLYTYAIRKGFFQSVNAVLDFLFWKLKMRRSELEAAMSRLSVDELLTLPILIACARFSCVGEFIKVLNFAQRCQAERMVDGIGWTSLHHACASQRKGNVIALTCMCPHLLDIATPTGVTPLMVAADYGASQILEHLLSLTKRHLSSKRDVNGRTVLHYAASSLNIPDESKARQMIQILLTRAKKDDDLALLMGTVHDFGTVTHTSVKRLLDTQMQDADRSPSKLLQLAVKKENWFLVTELINKGAKISTLDKEILSDLGLYETKRLDQPNSEDSLGREGLAKGIASLFLNPFATPPITVGVFGSWGMGKSSIMLQTQSHILMTVIERNLLSPKMDLSNSIKGRLATTKVEELYNKVLEALKELTHPQLNESGSKVKMFWKWWPSSKKKERKMHKDIEDFVSVYRPECLLLYKSLALMSRHDLAIYHSIEKDHGSTFSVEVPSCLTIYYNAWLYSGESDASSGLALTIMQELEACMNTVQWLILCWHYARRVDPIFIFTNIYLPLLVLVVVGGFISWIIWILMSTSSIANQGPWSKFKYGSIPISTIVIVWIILRKIVNVLRPVSMQILQSANTSDKYTSRIGYHQQIINDINFFKSHLGEKPRLWWKIIGRMWSLIYENNDYIPRCNIKKFQVSNDELRIVVFIDDLDRCANPKYILELIGATNLILSACAINVVIGMDKNIVKNVLESELTYDPEDIEKFLEKIINVPIDLFDPSGMETTTFLEDQLIYAKPKKNVMVLESSNETNLNVHKRKVQEAQISLGFNPYLFSQHQGSLQQMDTRDTLCFQGHGFPILQKDLTPVFQPMECKSMQHFQGHVAVNLQEDSSPSDFGSEEVELAMIGPTKEESKGSKLNVPIVENDKGILHPTLSKINLGNNIHGQHTSSELECNPILESQQKGYNRAKNKLVVQFPLSLTSYSEVEVSVFKVIQKKAKREQKKPRNWKRLLSYHQLVRSILLESKKDTLDQIFGWQQQLIMWLFVCYNWKEQMNMVFENWEDLVVSSLELGSAKPTWPSLHHLVSLQKMKHENLLTNIEINNGKNERNLKEWRSLEEILSRGYDVAMESIDIFQNYRLHCTIGHIDLVEDMGMTKM